MSLNWLFKRRPTAENKYATQRQKPSRWRRSSLALERLEDRLTPAVNFMTLGTDLSARLNTIAADLATIGSANVLPVVGVPLSAVPQASNIISSFQSTLVDKVNDGGDVQQNIFDGLGPNGLNLLGDTDNVPGITENDVKVEFANGNNDVTITLHLVKDPQAGAPDTTVFGLGLPSVPLVFAEGDTEVRTGWEFKNLVFGATNGSTFFLNASPDGFKVTLDAGIPGATPTDPMKGILGFLPVQAHDADPLNTPTFFHGEFVMDVTGAAHLVNPRLTGEADVHLKLATNADVMFSGETSLPGITTDFNMHWEFAGSDPTGPSTSFGGLQAPTVRFESVQLNVGSTLSNLVNPWLVKLDEVLTPIKPAIDVLTQPIPEISGYIGANTSLVDLLENVGAIPQSMADLIRLAADVVTLTSDIPNVTMAISGVNIDFGTLDLGAANGDLRQLPQAGDFLALGQSLTDLLATGISEITFADLKAQVIAGAPAAIQPAVENVLNFFDPAVNSHVTFDVPLLSDPANGLVQLLLGRDATIAHFRAEYHDQKASISGEFLFPLVPLSAYISFSGEITMDATFGIGYDTVGLRAFAHEFLNNPSSLPAEQLRLGVFLDGDTNISLTGSFDGLLVVIGPLASAVIDGGLSANFNLAIENPTGDATVRLFDNPNACLFHTGGKVSFELSGVAGVVILPLPGPVIYPFSTGEIVLLDMSDCIANPFQVPPSFRLAGPAAAVPGTTDEFVVSGPLTLHIGPKAADRISFDTADGAEVFLIAHDAPKLDDPPGEAILVTAFGVTQRYAGVTSISADGGVMDDVIFVGEGVQSPVTFNGGSGNDQLTYKGDGAATLDGGLGMDDLKGGNGTNNLNGGPNDDHLTGGNGVNNLSGDAHNDVLLGGQGLNNLYGNDGDDQLYAGPQNDFLFGGSGKDVLTAGAGAAVLIGNAGNDTFIWQAGNGGVTVAGNENQDVISLFGSAGADVFTFSPAGTSVAVVAPGANLTLTGVETINVEGGLGADTITVNDLVEAGVLNVNVNLQDLAIPDGQEDHVFVNGRSLPDQYRIEPETVVIGDLDSYLKEGHSGGPSGGITKISRGDYVVRTANIVDDVRVSSFAGVDGFVILGVTGPTIVNGGSEDDTYHVLAKAPTDYLGLLTLDAGGGMNTLHVNESASLISDNVTLTKNTVAGTLLPNGISFMATGGNYRGGVTLTGGTQNDTINLTETLPDVLTTVNGGPGDDRVNVSSDAPANAGHLADINGTLTVDLGAGANNVLTLSDVAATAGNQDVKITPSQVLGFAGPADNVIVNFQATGGQMVLDLRGSDSSALAERFSVKAPLASLQLQTNAGNEAVTVEGLSQPATVNAGAGDDAITVGDAGNTLNSLGAPLTVSGEAGNDVLDVIDTGTASWQNYTLGSASISRSGAGQITHNGLEAVAVSAGAWDDQFTVSAQQTTPVLLRAGLGTDSVRGPFAGVWQITGPYAGTLNGNVQYVEFEQLRGGSGGDRFVFTPGAGFLGAVNGGSGDDTLDYSAFTADTKGVSVILPSGSATGVKGDVLDVERAIGGAGNDLLVGDDSDNRLWGGAGDDILVGNGGADRLFGDDGRDILIGGLGTDQLLGGLGDDILIGGGTSYDSNSKANLTALQAIRAEWTRTDVIYRDRIEHLAKGGGLNGLYRLNSTTVFDEGAVDMLQGQEDQDWFWVNPTQPKALTVIADVHDAASDEAVSRSSPVSSSSSPLI